MKKIMFIMLLFVVGLFLVSSVSAANYTVGSGGTYSTIQACANAASSGDICSIKAGTYNERVNVNRAGVSFVGETYRTATVNGGFVINVANTRIEDLRITTTTRENAGVMLWEAADNTKIYDNYFFDVNAGSAIWGPLGSADTSDNVHVKDNLFHRVQIGIHAVGNNWLIENNEIDSLYTWGSGGTQYNRFHGSNQIWRNNYWHGAEKPDTGSGHVDCFQTWSHDIPMTKNVTIENNICINFNAFGMIQADVGGGKLDGLVIRNNIGYNTPDSDYLDNAFALNLEDPTNIVIEHNTFIGATWYSVYFNNIGASDIPSGIMKNNLIISTGSNAWNAVGCNGNCLIKNNLWWTAQTPTPTPDSTNINANPMLTDIVNLNFKPLPGSPACTGGEGGTYIGAVPCGPVTECTDFDGDGYGSPASSSCTYSQLDCDNNNANIHPGATEICGNGIDEDCNGSDLGCTVINPDTNGDGCISLGEVSAYVSLWLQGQVTLSQVSSAVSLWLQGCEPALTCTDTDGDGYGNFIPNSCANPGLDCHITDSTINPGVVEICNDGWDNDCDTQEDCIDTQCFNNPACIQNLDCTVTVQSGQSIQTAVNNAATGAVICIAPGTYNGRVTVTKSGITIKGQTRRTATVVNGFDVNVPNVRIEGLIIAANTTSLTNGVVALMGGADNAKIYDNYFLDNHGTSIGSPYWTTSVPDNVHIKDNLFYRPQVGINAAGDYWIIENNEIDSLKHWGAGGPAQYTEMHGSNQIWRNNYFHGAKITETGGGHVDCFKTSDQNTALFNNNITIENNTCIDFHTFVLLQRMVNTNGVSRIDGTIIRNNIAISTPEAGYLADNVKTLNLENPTNTIVEHNTFIGFKSYGIFLYDIYGYGALTGVTKNNLIMNEEFISTSNAWWGWGGYGQNEIKYNLWWNTRPPEGYGGSPNINVDPMLTDINNLNVKPLPGSPACTGGEGGTYIGAVPCD